jgi:hypothetical protein
MGESASRGSCKIEGVAHLIVVGFNGRMHLSIKERGAIMQPLAIPEIEDDDLLSAVSALTRAACIMRALFLHVAEGESAIQLLQKHDEVATLAETVIDRWREHLGIDLDDALVN